MRSLPKLHLITDAVIQQNYNHQELVYQVPKHSNIAIQFREKNLSDSKYAQLKQIYTYCLNKDIPLIINDYDFICANFPEAGIHVGAEDTPLTEVCSRFPGRIIGATVHNEQELNLVQQFPISYVGVGPVFTTNSKRISLPLLGLKGLEHICKNTHLPVIAIGGITEDNASSVLQSGAYGFAVIGAWCNSYKPAESIQKLLRVF